MKKIIFLFVCFAFAANINAQNVKNVWDSIKSSTMPVVAPAFQSEYDAPYKQPLADYGWEDGLQISQSGLKLYALYSPMDFLSWVNFFVTHTTLPVCSLYANMSFVRQYAQTYGMDLVTNPFGCDSFVNIDILYAQRHAVTDSFTTWQLSGIARGGAIEGSPAPLASETDTDKVDLFFFTGNNDIWMIKNTTNNPTGITSATRLPAPINPNTNEFNADNPFAERINSDTIILIYEKYTNANTRTFMYVLSNDLGITWSAPQAITSITNSLGHIEHPCLYKDSTNQWWLYFSVNYSDIVRSQQTIAGNWDSWAAPQIIISKGNAISIGEPTVTKNGDISFSVAYINTIINDSTDVYDLDPWFLPHKTLTSINENIISGNDVKLTISPNPFSTQTVLRSDYSFHNATLTVYNCFGQEVYPSVIRNSDSFVISRGNLVAGIYFVELLNGNGRVVRKVAVQ